MEFNISIFIAQALNFAIVFFLFKKLVGNKIFASIQERKELLRKASHAETIYQEQFEEGQKKLNELIIEGVERKNEIISEGVQLAKIQADAVLASAMQQAKKIEADAALNASLIETELKDAFESGIKRTTQLVVNKLFNDDVSLQEGYVTQLVKEFNK